MKLTDEQRDILIRLQQFNEQAEDYEYKVVRFVGKNAIELKVVDKIFDKETSCVLLFNELFDVLENLEAGILDFETLEDI